MQAASDCRKELGEDFLKKYGVKLGFMSFFVRAATLALQEYPVVNSVIDGNEIVRRNYIDMSVAVATPTGLLVPVLKNCQNMKFQDIDMVHKARSPSKTCKAELSPFPTVALSAH
jgi:2-oxoglutarate dehydrogenase E2 component (dihydrolipoamide succinyltransferase)